MCTCDVFGDLKIYVSEALARFARSHFFFCRYIWGSCPPNTKKLATLVARVDWSIYSGRCFELGAVMLVVGDLININRRVCHLGRVGRLVPIMSETQDPSRAVADPGGGPNRPRPPLLSDDFNFSGFFFFLLATPEVGLVGGRYPYPIM